jgi:O-succinylbenzoic acid--CoA ligase
LYQGRLAPAALEAWCRERLPSPRRPRLFVALDDWPRLASGKEDRARLRELASARWRQRAQASAAPIAPRDPPG